MDPMGIYYHHTNFQYVFFFVSKILNVYKCEEETYMNMDMARKLLTKPPFCHCLVALMRACVDFLKAPQAMEKAFVL